MQRTVPYGDICSDGSFRAAVKDPDSCPGGEHTAIQSAHSTLGLCVVRAHRCPQAARTYTHRSPGKLARSRISSLA